MCRTAASTPARPTPSGSTPSPAEVRLAAKTGWINGAAAMVGRIASQPTRRFALMVNGRFGWPAAEAIEDRIVALLTSGLTP